MALQRYWPRFSDFLRETEIGILCVCNLLIQDTEFILKKEEQLGGQAQELMVLAWL